MCLVITYFQYSCSTSKTLIISFQTQHNYLTTPSIIYIHLLTETWNRQPQSRHTNYSIFFFVVYPSERNDITNHPQQSTAKQRLLPSSSLSLYSAPSHQNFPNFNRDLILRPFLKNDLQTPVTLQLMHSFLAIFNRQYHHASTIPCGNQILTKD